MRLKLSLLAAAFAFIAMPAVAQTHGASAFDWFQALCLETESDPVKAAEAAGRAGWHNSGGGFNVDGATVEHIFTSPGENTSILMVMTVPASAINFDASARLCLVGENGADELEMRRMIREWVGFSPENDGSFEFWAYSTVDGERRPTRGLVDLSGDELVARVRAEGIQVIGVLAAGSGPSSAAITPFE